GPTVWITWRAGKSKPGVMRASPMGQRTPGLVSGSRRQASSRAGPAARWIAPSTPPPPSRPGLAALTMASTRSVVISAVTMSRGMALEVAGSLCCDQVSSGRGRRIMARTEDLSFGYLLNDVTLLFRKHFDRRAVKFGLTRVQWRATKMLYHREGLRQTELAELLEMEP